MRRLGGSKEHAWVIPGAGSAAWVERTHRPFDLDLDCSFVVCKTYSSPVPVADVGPAIEQTDRSAMRPCFE